MATVSSLLLEFCSAWAGVVADATSGLGVDDGDKMLCAAAGAPGLRPLSRSKGRCFISDAFVRTSATGTGMRQLLSAMLGDINARRRA